jgi:hypothetical protein
VDHADDMGEWGGRSRVRVDGCVFVHMLVGSLIGEETLGDRDDGEEGDYPVAAGLVN